MAGPAEGVAQLLSTSTPPVGSLGGPTTVDWRIGIGKMLDKPDRQICCYDVSGQNPNPKWLLDYPAVNIIVRGAPQDYRAANQKATDCIDVLLGQFPRIVNGDSWDAITVISSSSHVGNDANDRPMFSMNVQIILEPAASALTHRLPLGT